MDCRLCSNESVNFDDHCEEHQTCYNCGSNDDCDCMQEMECRSWCCTGIISDNGICLDCGDESHTILEDLLNNGDCIIQNNKLIKGVKNDLQQF